MYWESREWTDRESRASKDYMSVYPSTCFKLDIQQLYLSILKRNLQKEQLIEKLVNFKGFPQEANLPSAPKQFIQYLEEDNRPQVTQDVNYENGMGVSIGRLREDSMFDYKFSWTVS